MDSIEQLSICFLRVEPAEVVGMEHNHLQKVNNVQLHYPHFVLQVWQILALVYQLVQEGKTATQREAYYCLVKHFKSQAEFNNTLQGAFTTHLYSDTLTTIIDVVAFTGCTRDSLGICASSSGGVAGLLLWKVQLVTDFS